MEIIKKIVDSRKYHLKCPYNMKPTRIIVHNTANDASAINEVNYMSSNNKQISFHYAVDDQQIVQGIEENRNSWNAGDGINGLGNRQGIAIEICYSKSGGSKFLQAEKNAVILIADILKRYKFDIEQVTKHQDYSHKYCPHRTLDLGWDRFINMISEELKQTNNNNQKKDQILKKGEKFMIPGIFQVIDASAKLDAITCLSLADQPFLKYNYIDALPLVKTDSKGRKIDNQILKKNDYFICPDKIIVFCYVYD
ncbi:MAG: N-acetylmuramoyl-L-alanine amidase [Bacilli bacterium]